jgi:hypothetical protein
MVILERWYRLTLLFQKQNGTTHTLRCYVSIQGRSRTNSIKLLPSILHRQQWETWFVAYSFQDNFPSLFILKCYSEMCTVDSRKTEELVELNYSTTDNNILTWTMPNKKFTIHPTVIELKLWTPVVQSVKWLATWRTTQIFPFVIIADRQTLQTNSFSFKGQW